MLRFLGWLLGSFGIVRLEVMVVWIADFVKKGHYPV